MSSHAELAEDWAQHLAEAGLREPRRLLTDSPAELLAGGTWVALTKPGLGGRERWQWNLNGSGERALYLKRYGRTRLGEQLDRVRRQTAWHSRAWWEYRQAAELARRHIPVARAIAVVEEMRGVYEVRSAVLLERVPGDAFDRVWAKLVRDGAAIVSGPARHDVVRRLARFVSAFHQTGTCHRDLYLCHIFVEFDAAGTRPPRFALIDLARTHRPRLRRTRWLIKDLSQLDSSAQQVGASRSDRLRFLLTYLGLERGAPRARWFARRVARKSAGILRRSARKSGA